MLTGSTLRAVPYLSDVRHRRVLDAGGDEIGRLKDLAVVPRDRFPAVEWAILATGEGERVVRWSDVAIEPAHVRLRRRLMGIARETLPADALRLGRDLLDKRIRDTQGARLVRVNDLQLEETGGQLRLLGVDIGTRGLLRRIGMERLVDGVTRIVGRSLPRRLVSWPAVQLVD
jgi:sporulation protein YlmC with PRC-barrel domain